MSSCGVICGDGKHRFAANKVTTAAIAVPAYTQRMPVVKWSAVTGPGAARTPAIDTVTAPSEAVPRFMPIWREVLVIALAAPARSFGIDATAEEVDGGFASPIPVPRRAKAASTHPIGEEIDAARASTAIADARKQYAIRIGRRGPNLPSRRPDTVAAISVATVSGSAISPASHGVYPRTCCRYSALTKFIPVRQK
ncbi:hypothetical protein L618_004000000040 [Rhodococcus rhodochrous J45]|uniref:Uncharacterized protein n=1 Tax=Rhodococcus rhodochrous J45 TaxID=935266 RepID=A0A562DL12_RHORH|nr:hypothetical protein L618_004000000040 [Rhodococcus rhodochrous J45]